MLAIFKWSLWQRRWSIVWWSIGVGSFILVNMVFYPSFKDQAAELQKSFENLPDSAVSFIGGSTDFFSPVGFLNSQIFFLMLPLLLGVLAIGLGSSLLAKEEQDHTIDSLLGKPISRSKLLLCKGTVGATILFIITMVALLVTLLAAKVVDIDVLPIRIIVATLACFLLCLVFGAVAFAITALGKARAASLGIASLIALGGYLISSLSETVTWLQSISKLLPFHYYQPQPILRGAYNWANFLFFIIATLLCGLLAWLAFRKRDIY